MLSIHDWRTECQMEEEKTDNADSQHRGTESRSRKKTNVFKESNQEKNLKYEISQLSPELAKEQNQYIPKLRKVQVHICGSELFLV